MTHWVDDAAALEKLRQGSLDEKETSLRFDYPSGSEDRCDAEAEKHISRLCEGLEFLKTNTCIRNVSIDSYLRRGKGKEDAKRVERAYVTLGEYLAINASVESLDFDIDYLSDAACSAIAEGIRCNRSLNHLRLDYAARDVTPQGIDMLA